MTGADREVLDLELAGRAHRLPAYVPKDVAANELGISMTTLWRRIQAGTLEVVRDEGRMLIPRRSLLAYIARRDAGMELAELPKTLEALGDEPNSPRRVVPLSGRRGNLGRQPTEGDSRVR